MRMGQGDRDGPGGVGMGKSPVHTVPEVCKGDGQGNVMMGTGGGDGRGVWGWRAFLTRVVPCGALVG
jgi:hypothetical protein